MCIISIRRRWMALPRLIRFLLTHFADGAAVGGLLCLVLLLLDVARIGTMLEEAGSGSLILLLFAQSCIYFGMAYVSLAVLFLDKR